jgi:hypothetical protein
MLGRINATLAQIAMNAPSLAVVSTIKRSGLPG